MRQVFRHEIPNHGKVFEAIVVVTQISINNGEQLFACGYRDPPYAKTNIDNANECNTEDDIDSDLSYDTHSL